MDFKETVSAPTYSKSAKLIIDADSLIYRAAHIGEKVCLEADVPKDHPLFNELAPDLHTEQRVVLKGMIDGITRDVEVELNSKGYSLGDVELHYTPKGTIQKAKGLKPNFRYKVIDDFNEANDTEVPGYKSGRKNMKLPEGLDELFNFAVEDKRAVLADGCESDDVVCYLKAENVEGVVIAALDKDILNGSYSGTIGHFNFNKREWIYTTAEEAELNIYRQCLTGDASDTIKGINRVGPKGAEKILPEWSDDMWDKVLAIHLEKGYTEEYAIMTMRLVGMHQYGAMGVTLWQPPLSNIVTETP